MREEGRWGPPRSRQCRQQPCAPQQLLTPRQHAGLSEALRAADWRLKRNPCRTPQGRLAGALSHAVPEGLRLPTMGTALGTSPEGRHRLRHTAPPSTKVRSAAAWSGGRNLVYGTMLRWKPLSKPEFLLREEMWRRCPHCGPESQPMQRSRPIRQEQRLESAMEEAVRIGGKEANVPRRVRLWGLFRRKPCGQRTPRSPEREVF